MTRGMNYFPMPGGEYPFAASSRNRDVALMNEAMMEVTEQNP